MLTPSCAVTTVVIVFTPTANAMLPEAVPEVTAEPFTFTAAVALAVTGVRVTDVVALLTDAA